MIVGTFDCLEHRLIHLPAAGPECSDYAKRQNKKAGQHKWRIQHDKPDRGGY
jgi:hypothetical protein